MSTASLVIDCTASGVVVNDESHRRNIERLRIERIREEVYRRHVGPEGRPSVIVEPARPFLARVMFGLGYRLGRLWFKVSGRTGGDAAHR